jgi:hypothetical protein
VSAAEGNRDLADRTWVHDVVVEVYELDSQLARHRLHQLVLPYQAVVNQYLAEKTPAAQLLLEGR